LASAGELRHLCAVPDFHEGDHLAWKRDVRVDTVPDPSTEEPTDALYGSPPRASADLMEAHGAPVAKLAQDAAGFLPDALATHRLPLGEGPRGYEIFQKKQDGAIKVVLSP
jgi:hypothetical protein